jgi:hypothetical protein
MFFVAGEVALVTWLILGRLDRLERRVAASVSGGDTEDRHHADAAATVARSRPAEASPFAWLNDTDRTGVFIPVLMGAGLILSAAAYVVQRIAQSTARTVAEPALSADLARLSPRCETLDPRRGPALAVRDRLDDHGPLPSPSPARRLGLVGLVALGLGLGFMAVDRIADATQTRPEAAQGVDSVILLDISTDRDLAAAAQDLWRVCATTLPQRTELVSANVIDDNRVVIVVRPGLGDRAWRRVEGCLEDMTLRWITAAAQRLEPAVASDATG